MSKFLKRIKHLHGLRFQGCWQTIQKRAGFTLIELFIALSIISILLVTGYAFLRTPKAKIACKNIYSAMQLTRMRTITTGFHAYVDFDMNKGNVSDNFYTVYLDTDRKNSSFGEIANSIGENEFFESQVAMEDSLGGITGVALPEGIAFGLPAINPPGKTPTGGSFSSGVLSSGVSFTSGSKRIKFLPKGTPSGFGGSVYIYDVNDSTGIGCSVIVASTGIIRMWNWDGDNWR